MLFAWVYSSPPLSPSAGNESHLLALIWESKELEPQRAQGFAEEQRTRVFPVFLCVSSVSSVVKNLISQPVELKLPNYKFAPKCSHPPALSGRAFPSAPISRIPAVRVVRPIRVTRTPATTEGTAAADVNSSS
jgi:hypothetical protein